MVKILNLDELEIDSGRAIVLNKETHEMKPFSVGDFIRTMKAADAAAKGEQQGIEDVLAQMIDMIDRAFPTLPRVEVEALDFDKLKAIFEFVQATEDTDLQEAKETAGKLQEKVA